tara:strand:- start:253 stop:504 length:252 start_codon:yes stop_codon:yes gene_type:complete
MCIDFTPQYKGIPGPPAVKPRIEQDSSLPAKKVVADDAKADVEYGQGEKKATPADKRRGTDQLKIDMNTGGSSIGEATGGANK